jgi:hypothetical protein
MNPGWCKKCGAAIYWVPRPDGGWHRPMERLKTQLPQEVQDFIDGAQAMRVEDGVVEPFRFSSILVMHICEPKPDEVIESIQAGVQIKPGKVSKKVRKRMQREAREEALRREIDRIEAERIVAERAAARAAQEAEQAERDSLKRKTTMATRHGEFLRATCPYCQAEAGEPCHTMSIGVKPHSSHYYNTKPHQQRVDWAYGSGLIEEPIESLYSPYWTDLVKDPSVPRQRELLAWLRDHQGFWSEDWPTTSELVDPAGWEDESVR